MAIEIITPKTCANCFAKFRNGNDIQCRLNPPQAYPIITHTAGGPQIIGQTNQFPIVQPDWSCRQHKPGLAVNMDEMRYEELTA